MELLSRRPERRSPPTCQPTSPRDPSLTPATFIRAQTYTDECSTTRRLAVHDVVSPAALTRGRQEPARAPEVCPRRTDARASLQHTHARLHRPSTADPRARFPLAGGAARHTHAAPPACARSQGVAIKMATRGAQSNPCLVVSVRVATSYVMLVVVSRVLSASKDQRQRRKGWPCAPLGPPEAKLRAEGVHYYR